MRCSQEGNAIGCAIIIVAAVIFAGLAGAAGMAIEQRLHRPRLVGFGCVGAAGPLYAMEEDHLPLCTRIERY